MDNYAQLSDEELVVLAKEEDFLAEELLYEKYKGLVRARSRSYFLIGADREDIMQEGMIGLHKAIRDYRPGRQASFHTFAEMCIVRQIITAIKTATRQKHIPLNSYVSLSRPMFEDDTEHTLMDVLKVPKATDPEELLIGQESYKSIQEKINTVLSPLEKETLVLFLQGKSYQEIAEQLDRHSKSIDNALQRIKRKIEKALLESEDGQNMIKSKVK